MSSTSHPADPRARSSAIILVLASIFSLQAGAALAKQLFVTFTPLGTTTLRLTFAALLLGAVWRPWRLRLTRPARRAAVAYGLALAVMNTCFYLALARIPLGIAVAFEFTGPLAVALAASRQPLDFAWAALAAAGIVALLPLTGASHALDWLGVLYALGAGAGWAGYIVFGQRAGQGNAGARIVALGTGVAAAAVLPVGVASAGATLWSPATFPLALAVAIASSALPYSLEMLAMQRLPAKSFGILMSLEPAIGALTGRVLLHESLAPLQWVAIACIVLASVGSAQQAPAAAPAG